MLGHTLRAGLVAGDQQYFVDPCHGLANRYRVGVVQRAGLDATFVQIGEFGGVSASRNDLSGGDVALEQGFNDESAELAGGTCNEDGHGVFLSRMN